MTRAEILDRAKEIITHDRNNQYGEPEDSFGLIALYWSVYLKEQILASDVAAMMALLKVARIQEGVQNEDSVLDAIGYLACMGEIKYGKVNDTKAKG